MLLDDLDANESSDDDDEQYLARDHLDHCRGGEISGQCDYTSLLAAPWAAAVVASTVHSAAQGGGVQHAEHAIELWRSNGLD